MKRSRLNSWCDVDVAALRHNVALFRAHLAPGSLLGVVVKSNAYGHGVEIASQAFVDAGVDWLIVNDVDEALALRTLQPDVGIYICGPVPTWRAADVLRADARVVVHSAEFVEALADAADACGQIARLHIKLETGNQRQGLDTPEALVLARDIVDHPSLEFEGLTTHFADIEDTTDHGFARQQLERFDAAWRQLDASGTRPAMGHAANSAAAILWPESHRGLVRVGLAAYGLWPSKETYITALESHARGEASMVPELLPALSWRCRVAAVKQVPSGAYIGYGRTYRTTHPSTIAVLPVGYHEGYDRRLSNLGHVLIRGRRAPVRGRVCMNMLMVDVTHIEGVNLGDEVTLLGRCEAEHVSAEMLADWMGTINYEVVCRIHPGQPRLRS